jgi:hypothetical protein
MAAEKDTITSELRHEIMMNADYLVETERADLLKITLSFRSQVKPERHVWIDTQMGEDRNEFSVDLEDWTYERNWDNAVATVDTQNMQVARDVTQSWLQGESLEKCLQHCVGCKIERK